MSTASARLTTIEEVHCLTSLPPTEQEVKDLLDAIDLRGVNGPTGWYPPPTNDCTNVAILVVSKAAMARCERNFDYPGNSVHLRYTSIMRDSVLRGIESLPTLCYQESSTRHYLSKEAIPSLVRNTFNLSAECEVAIFDLRTIYKLLFGRLIALYGTNYTTFTDGSTATIKELAVYAIREVLSNIARKIELHTVLLYFTYNAVMLGLVSKDSNLVCLHTEPRVVTEEYTTTAKANCCDLYCILSDAVSTF